jgi:hypothetical protein
MASPGKEIAGVDPERARVEALVLLVGRGEASEAEREELALYAEHDPAILTRVKAIHQDRATGGAWLDRIEADHRLQAVETSRRTRLERVTGLGLLAAGILGAFAHPIVGAAGIALGLVVLTWSVLRVRIGTLGDDPYKDVKR